MHIKRLFILALLILLGLAACRREEEPTPLPTVAPTAALPETVEQGGSTDSPTAVPQPETVNAAAIDWPPRVVYSDPLPGEETPPGAPILVWFDQPMDQASVEAAFVLAQAENGREIKGDFSWPRPDAFQFTPKSRLQAKQRYTIQIDAQAASANGQTMAAPFQFDIQTAGPLEVNQTIPEDGTSGVQTGAAVTVLFNQPVVPLVGGAQQADLPQPLTFDPPVAGAGEWTSTSIYRFTPAEPLAGATTYRVTVDDLTSVAGLSLAPYSWQFTTLSPEVVITQPEEGGFIAPTETISVTFNMPMDQAATEAAITLRGVDAPAVSLDYVWSADGRTVGVTPQQPLSMGTEYQLRVSPAAAAGAAALAQEYIAVYNTWPLPAVQSVTPEPNSVPDQWVRGAAIQFVSPMDWDTVEDRLIIEPDPGVTRYFVNPYSNRVNVEFSYEPDTEYTITLPGDAADPYGNTLGADFTWRFRSPGLSPIASFNLPPFVSQLSVNVASVVEIVHVNSGNIQVALYDMGLPAHLFNSVYSVQDYQPAAEPQQSWQITPQTARNEAGVYRLPLAAAGQALPTGVYLLALDAANVNEDARYWQNQKNLLVVGDTNVTVKEMFGSVHVWTTDIGSGQPVGGRRLTLFNGQGVEVGTAVSDENGFASFAYQTANDYLEGVSVVSGAPGEAGFGVGNSAWNQNISGWSFGLRATNVNEADLFVYLYTDRPIYRPGDTIYYKGIAREPNYGRYAIPAPRPLELKLVYNNYAASGQNVDVTLSVETDANGTFYGEYTLPEDAPTGNYDLYFQDDDVNGRVGITVAEYRRPEFQVTLTPEKEAALRGEAVNVALEARYFFGGAAAGLPVDWRLTEEAYSFSVPGLYYSFGDNAQFNYRPPGPFGGFDSNFLFGDNGVTDENGRLAIPLPADLLAGAEEGSRVVTVEATVQDVSGFPITSRAQIIFHAAEVIVGVTPQSYIGSAGRETAVDLITVDWEGNPLPNQTVEVTFYRREWRPVRAAGEFEYYTAWETEDTEAARVTAQTDGRGQAQAAFTPEEGGSYLAVAVARDGAGRAHLSSAPLYVTDSNNPIAWRSDPAQKTMALTPDKPDYKVGETARILVQSPFTETVRAWLTIERGTLIEQRVITLNGSGELLEIPVTADYAPNVFVTVTAVRGLNPDNAANPYADIRIGIAELVVSPEQLTLNVQLTPRETLQEPGETAVYDVLVTDYAGNPVANADLSLALVDLAVLTLKDDNAVPIVEAFYSRQPYRSQLGAGLFISGEGLPLEIPIEGFGGRGGGGGDLAAEAAPALAEEEDVRRDFPDTAFWQPSVTTDGDGRAVVEIPLPDTLTTWRLSSKGVTAGTLVGQAEVDITTTLPLLLRPITPRFFTVGDEVSLGAVVHNNTAEEIEAAVSLQADGLTLGDPQEQTITIAAGDKAVARWQVSVDNVDFADLTFRVNGGGFSDATKPSFGVGEDNLIPVLNFTAQDVVGTSGELAGESRRVEAILLPPGVDPEQGAVEITLSASLGAAVLDGLELVNYLEISQSCASSVAHQLAPNAAVANLVKQLNLSEIEQSLQPEMDETINASVARLEELQREDGGWGWCSASESVPWTSAYVLLGLLKAEQAGYPVNRALIGGAVGYLEQQIRPAAALKQPGEVNFQATMLYVLAEAGKDTTPQADDLLAEHRELLLPSAKAMLALAYELNGAGGNSQKALLSDLNNSAVVSATGAHWEAPDTPCASLCNDIYETAVVVNALSRINSQNPNLPPAVRWLMNARAAVIWPGAYQTAWSIMGLTEWLAASGELDADYEYAVLANLQGVADGRFGPENVAESRDVAIPLTGLLLDEVNYVAFQRGGGDGVLYYTLHLNSAIDANQVGPLNRGFSIERVYYDAACDPAEETCEPIEQIEAGQRVRVVLTVIAPNDRLYVTLEDPIPAGATAIDPGLNTTSPDLGGAIGPADRPDAWGYWGWWYFDNIEYRDEKVVFQSQFLPAGTYQYSYFLETNIPGRYQVMPTFAREELSPEVNGRAAGMVFTITE